MAGGFFGAGSCMLPESEFNRLKKIVSVGLDHEHLLTDFDSGFLSDYAIKFEQYKRHTFVSDNQDEQFNRIEKYLREELGDDAFA